MAGISPDAQRTALLRVFDRRTTGRLSAGDIRKKLGPDAAEAGGALAALVEEGLVAVAGGAREGPHPRPNASYRLTEKGRQHARPTRPDIPDEQLQAQESFILLQVFRSKEQKLTRSDLNGKLKTKAAVGQLEFDVKEAPGTIDYHLAALVEKGYLDEQRRGVSVSYSLNSDEGTKALASARQHDGVSFTLSGETLNALLAARHAEPGRSGAVESIDDEPPRVVREHDIAAYVDRLRADKYAGKDLIPIHEVRRLVAEHHGANAAGHPTFDPLLKRMRSEGRLELIAISDNRGASQEELDDAIPGMNETIFYIVVD